MKTRTGIWTKIRYNLMITAEFNYSLSLNNCNKHVLHIMYDKSVAIHVVQSNNAYG